MAIEAGQQLLHYRLTDKIGEGGMGVVWKATDTRLDRTVAIKVLRQQLAQGPRVRERFEREARAISNLNHPNICTLHDIGRADEIDFIVMEYLDGEVLVARLERGALPLDQALRCGVDIARALDEAHRAGIVHRDLKPGNIMLTRQGVKLMDFGLAKVNPLAGGSVDPATAPTVDRPITEVGTLIGTVPYMAPEQLEGKEADPRTDIFALGGVLHEMITGRRPFDGASQASLISAIMGAEPQPVSEVNPQAPPVLDHLIRRCLAKRADDRWHSARDLAGELEWIADSVTPKPVRPPSGSNKRAEYHVEYFTGADGASIAIGRGGEGRPLMVLPTIVDTIETSWAGYAEALEGRELIVYDRRGAGLSERGVVPSEPEPYLRDAQAVIEGLDLRDFDILGTLLGTSEAAWIAAHNVGRVRRMVLRAPVLGLKDWASIPGVRAALSTLEHDWDYFTESFAQFVVGWGNPKGPDLAARIRSITSRDEIRGMLEAFMKLDLAALYGEIEAASLVEHHPGYFFPDSYSRKIAARIRNCRMAIFAGTKGEFLTDLSIAREFLSQS